MKAIFRSGKDVRWGLIGLAGGVGLSVVGLLMLQSVTGGVLPMVAEPPRIGDLQATPTAGLTVTLTTNRSGNQVDAGLWMGLIATVSGGNGIYTYTWTGLPPGCAGGNVSNVPCYESSAGSYSVQVSVHDTQGHSGQSSVVTIQWVADPSLTVHSPAPGLNWTDVGVLNFYGGQNITLYAGGGIAPYTWSTSVPAGLGCVGGRQWGGGSQAIAISWDCTPTTRGNYTVTVSYADSDGMSAPTSSRVFRVYSDMGVGTFTPTLSWAEVGQRLVLSAPVWGGNASAYYVGSAGVWYAGNGTSGWRGLGCGTNASIQSGQLWFRCTPTVGSTYQVSGSVTDGLSRTSTTTIWYTVAPNPTVTVTASPSTLRLGQSTTVTASATGGTGVYTYAWSSLPTGCSVTGGSPPGNVSSFSCTPSAAGRYDTRVNVTDTYGFMAMDRVNVTVGISASLQAQVGTYSAGTGGTLQDEVGALVSFNVSIVGGTAPYTCQLLQNGSGIPLATVTIATGWNCTITYTWAHGARYTTTVYANDSSSPVQSVTTRLTVSVGAPLSAAPLSVANATEDVGVPDVATVTYTGGLSAFLITWSWGDGSPHLNTSATSESHAWSKPGTYTTAVTVSDGGGIQRAVTSTVTVVIGPSENLTVTYIVGGVVHARTFSSPGGTLAVPTARNVWLNLSTAGGQLPYTLSWTLDGAPLSGVTSTLQEEWASPAGHTVRVSLTDSQGVQDLVVVTLQVVQGQLAPLSVTVQLSSTVVGAWDNITASTNCSSTAWPPCFWSWTISTGSSTVASGASTGSTLSVTRSWTTPGVFNVSVTASDQSGTSVTGTVQLMVYPDLTVGAPTVSGFPTVGEHLSFAAPVTGGITPYAISWSGLPGGCTSSSSATLGCTPTQAGQFSVAATVTDAYGERASSSTLPLSVSMSLTTTWSSAANVTTSGTLNVTAGVNVSVVGTYAGGVAPFTCTLTERGASGTLASTVSSDGNCLLTHWWSTTGNHLVTLTVTDSQGNSASDWVVLDVHAAPSPQPAASHPASWWSTWWWAPVLLVILLVLVIIGWAIARSRRLPPPKDDESSKKAKKESPPTDLPDWPGQ